jgi:hypothetical protein
VPDHRHPLMVNGVPVVEAPEEIDICNAEQLRIVLLEAFSVLVAAHNGCRPWSPLQQGPVAAPGPGTGKARR